MPLRRAVIFGGPLLAYVAGMLHPSHVLVSGSPWLYIGIHLAWPLIACLLAWAFLLLVANVRGKAAAAVRVLAIPFAVAYTLFTAYDGVGIGALVWKANGLPAAEQPAAAELISNVTHSGLGGVLRLVASALWLATVICVVVALRDRAPVVALALVTLGAAAFAYRHEPPWGPWGMAAVLAGLVWLELQPSASTDSRIVNPIRTGR